MATSLDENLEKEFINAEIQEKRWQALYNSVEEGICIVDKNSRILSFNPACEVMSGYRENEVTGKLYHEVFGCHDAKGNFLNNTLIKKAFILDESIPYDEHLHNQRNGEEMWVATTLVPYTNAEHDHECLIIIRDITTYKQVEKLKSDFVSIASHELRTPLTIVNGYLSLLVNGDFGQFADPARRDEQRKVLQKVYYETKRLSSLVEDLLDISRIEEGRLKFVMEKTDIVKLVGLIVAEMRPLAESENLSLEFSPPNLQKKVHCDPSRIKQVLTNLLDNAVKYTVKGGIKVTIKENGSVCTVSVADTGIGIKPKLKDKIFEKFQQDPGNYLKENEGTGLGLFIVKGIIELHKGKIWVESSNAGSTFSFSLPLEN